MVMAFTGVMTSAHGKAYGSGEVNSKLGIYPMGLAMDNGAFACHPALCWFFMRSWDSAREIHLGTSDSPAPCAGGGKPNEESKNACKKCASPPQK